MTTVLRMLFTIVQTRDEWFIFNERCFLCSFFLHFFFRRVVLILFIPMDMGGKLFDGVYYRRKLKPEILKKYGSKQAVLLRFDVVMPTYIRVPDGYLLTCDATDNFFPGVMHLAFHSFEEPLIFYGGQEPYESVRKKTRVECICCFDDVSTSDAIFCEIALKSLTVGGKGKNGAVLDGYLHDVQNRALCGFFSTLDSFFDVYLNVAYSALDTRVTSKMCSPLVSIDFLDSSDFEMLASIAFQTHSGNSSWVDFEHKSLQVLSGDELSLLTALLSASPHNINPFSVSFEYLTDAFRFARDGHTVQAVIGAQTSLELFLRAIYRQCILLGNTECLTYDEKLKGNDPRDFTKFLKQHLSVMRAINHVPICNKRKKETVVYWYWHTFYKDIRGRAVHMGYIPSQEETDKAVLNIHQIMMDVSKDCVTEHPELSQFLIISD